MELNEYQKLAQRTAPKVDSTADYVQNMLNFTLGLNGESGEVADLVKKWVFHEHPTDIEAIKKELGDCLWYISNLAELLMIELDDVATTNIEKLKKRFPDGFSTADSIARVDVKE